MMNNNYSFYNWFQKIISICIDIFFVGAVLATIYVFTSPFSGATKYLILAFGIIAYSLVFNFCRDYFKKILNKLFAKLVVIDIKTMMIIIFVVMLVLKTIYTLLFKFDATGDGDIEIYIDVADNIISNGIISSDAISHLYGVALHFVLFRLLGIPLHIGLFIFILIGTIINFYSFSKIVGKEKSFVIVMFYILMPSTSLLSLCPTHEVIFYSYVSLSLFLVCQIIREKNIYKYIGYGLFTVLFVVLGCLVNPGGMLLYIVLLLIALLTNLKINKKILLIGVLLLSIITNNIITKVLDIDEFTTTMNTYNILIHGSNPHSLGEQVDGYPLKEMRMYIYSRDDLHFSEETFKIAGKHVLFEQYKYLLTHPVTFVKLIAHKTYILWSGVHYPMELAFHFNAFSSLTFYLLLGINTLIYLFVLSIGLIPNNKNDDNCDISIYKLEFLGVFALTMFCIVANKYTLYVTIFLYLISFYRMGFYNEKQKS